jgi:hypothetical protein
MTIDAGTNKPDAKVDAPLPVRFAFRAPGPITWENPIHPGVWRGIWGTSPDNIYAVGSGGDIRHFQNGQWNREVSNTQYNIEDVWGSGPTDIYAAVDANIVLRSTGNGVWTKHLYAQGRTFQSVWGTGSDNVYLCCAGIFRSIGDNVWSEQIIPVNSGPFAIWGLDAQHIYYPSARGEVGFSSGDGKWSRQKVYPQDDSSDNLYAIWASDPNNIFVGGTDGLFYSAGDGKWEKLDDAISEITAIISAGNGVVFVVDGRRLNYIDQFGRMVHLMTFGISLTAAWSPAPGQIIVAPSGLAWGRF